MPKPQLLYYRYCGHTVDPATNTAINWTPAGARVKEILSACPKCQPKVKRLPHIPYEDQPW